MAYLHLAFPLSYNFNQENHGMTYKSLNAKIMHYIMIE